MRNLRESFFFFYLCDLINKIDIIGHSPTWSAAPIPNKSTRSIVMATKIDKIKLAQTINNLPDLDSETKSQLLQLIHERKQYGLVWEEHHEEVEQQMRTQLPVLVEDKSKFIDSADPHAPNHILIEGDNLPALTTLTYTHKEKIDVIYIDPPYNTGNKDFIYNDHFVGTDDDYRHSKWLSFMSKRLRIAKTLLSEKGVIFISIDDNEQAQLKMLCDEILGESNFLGEFIHQRAKGGGQAKHIVKGHDYILCYAHDADVASISRPKVIQQGIVVHNGIECLRNDDVIRKTFGKYDKTLGDRRCFYEELLQYKGQEKKDEVDALIANGTYTLEKNKMGMHTIVEYIPISSARSKHYSIIKVLSEEGKKELEELGISDFDYPKPLELIRLLVGSVYKTNSTILDFFAGSGTTLHATMQLNAEDGGHRQCILITNNENNICEEVTYERNKRVIQGYTTPKGESVAGLTANKLRYYRTDFVARESSLTAKKQLMLAATDLLCIKESIYTECHTFGNLRLRSSVVRYFADADARMLIIYNPDAIDTIVAEISRMNIVSPIRIYVFSANDYAYNADFETVDNKVSLCALPAAIYNAYRKVLPKKQQTQDEPATTDTELTFEEDTL